MNQLAQKIKNIRVKEVAYPAIVLGLIALTAVCLALAARFFSEHINKVFVVDERSVEETIVRIDLEEYYRVAERAGIHPLERAAPKPASPNLDGSSAPSVPSPGTPPTTPEPTPAPPTVVAPKEKSELAIRILNSTTRAGSAASLRALIQRSGFTGTIAVGNTSPQLSTTRVSAKASERESEALTALFNAVSEQYLPEDIQTFDESSSYDVEIVIGLK